jgi:PhnB protein
MTNQLEETEPISITPKPPQIIPYLIYRDVGAALDFLCRAFGFKEEQRHGTPSGGMHGEASFQDQLVMLGQGGREHSLKTPKDVGAATMGVFIYLDDVDTHYEAAKAADAEIVHPPKDVAYGRTYWANDPEGHPWFFTAPAKAS